MASRVLKGIDLDIEDGEFLILVGGSGCGKSTLLNMIAGLETGVTDGEIAIGGKRVNDLPPAESRYRDGVPELRTLSLDERAENIAFGLSLRKVPAEQDATIARVAKLVADESPLDRRQSATVRGQRQRVAMGRALAREPASFPFDEPLSNLDAKVTRRDAQRDQAAAQAALASPRCTITARPD